MGTWAACFFAGPFLSRSSACAYENIVGQDGGSVALLIDLGHYAGTFAFAGSANHLC